MGKYKSKFSGQEIDDGIEYGVRVTQQTFSSAQKQQARGNISAQETITDRATIGDGYAVCSTASDTQQKEVSITNFLLIKNGVVSVKFANAITVASPTLKINSNAAKAIYMNGAAVQAGWILAGATVNMRYNGVQFDIISIIEEEKTDDELLVDMGLPSGLLWATRNIDVTQANGFTKNIYQYECSFFSWGNTDGHNPTAINSFAPYSWTSQNYASSPGAALTASFGLSFDAAFTNLGNQWRMPTTEEFAELFNNIDFINADGTVIESTQTDKRVTVNGVTGILLKSKNNSRTLFFPCSGQGYIQSWLYRGTNGNYWSSSLHSSSKGLDFGFYSEGVLPQNNSGRFYGFPVRPVQIKIDTKTDKLPMTGAGAATENNFMAIDANGNIKDSGKKASDFQSAITDLAQIGCGYAACSTAGDVAAKTVTITNFVLLPNCRISVLFQNAFTAANPTLNVNNTGAKYIRLREAAIPINRVRYNNTILTMVLANDYWEVTNIESLSTTPTDGAVDMGLPSGTLWCDHNVGATNPEDYGLYFSWGNVDGHAIDDEYKFTVNNYNNSTGVALSGNIPVSKDYDAARANMGSPWRMPTNDECTELINYCTFEDGTVNGVNGCWATSNINGHSIFFPYAGNKTPSSHDSIGSAAYFRTTKYRGQYSLFFNDNSAQLRNFGTTFAQGWSVRGVQ